MKRENAILHSFEYASSTILILVLWKATLFEKFSDPISENSFEINAINVTSSAYLFNGLSNFESLYVQCMAFLNVSWVKNLLEMAVLKLSEFPFDTVFFL